VAVILAIEAGRCTSFVGQAPSECDLAAASKRLTEAASRMTRAREAVEKLR
jgi:hypothetical protein